MEQNKSTEAKTENQEQNIATEVFHEFKIQSRIAIVALVSLLAFGAVLYYKNDMDWKKLFSDYDFISQDGEGINNANYGEQGDLNNGAENKVKEE